MPRLSAWFVRAALVYLALGFTLGAVMLANEGLNILPDLDRLGPLHAELLLLGWIMQLGLGVAYWILPRFSQGQPRGNAGLAWAAFGLLNAGILLVLAGAAVTGADWLSFAGRLLEGMGVLVFIGVMWRRVRPSF
jgi:heme/copper-type cytochrome/quinol oxidase subunit 1